jgi:hypothetical protein
VYYFLVYPHRFLSWSRAIRSSPQNSLMLPLGQSRSRRGQGSASACRRDEMYELSTPSAKKSCVQRQHGNHLAKGRVNLAISGPKNNQLWQLNAMPQSSCVLYNNSPYMTIPTSAVQHQRPPPPPQPKKPEHPAQSLSQLIHPQYLLCSVKHPSPKLVRIALLGPPRRARRVPIC